MLIGKPGPALTAIATADAAGVTVRGRDLAGDLMGLLTFTDFFHLLVTGREPTGDQRFFLDLLLVAIAEHGLTPTAVAARMTYAAAPDAMQAAVAAGILGCGAVVLGTADVCGRVLVDAAARTAAGAVAAAGEPPAGVPAHHTPEPRWARSSRHAGRGRGRVGGA